MSIVRRQRRQHRLQRRPGAAVPCRVLHNLKHDVSRSTLSQFHQTQHSLVRRDTCGECSWLCR